jgi:hypothetical protein
MYKRILSFLLAALMLLACTACGGTSEDTADNIDNNIPEENVDPVPEPEPEPEIPAIVNPLTGEPMEDEELAKARPVAVMLNNIHVALPQHGQSDADMIFEFNVEGGITRMVAFYQDPSQAGTIGSVRSARPCFVETVIGMDAIYFHAGGSGAARNMISNYGVPSISKEGDPYWRDTERRKTMSYEHTLMTSGENIANYLESSSVRRQHEEDYIYPVTYVEVATPEGGQAANHISVRFSNYKTGLFDYDAESGLYMISEYNAPYVDGNTGEQVGTTNLLVLRTSVTNSGDAKAI